MAVPSSSLLTHIAMRPILAMFLILALTASFVNYAAGATGGAMGGGFSRGGGGYSSGRSYSRPYSVHSHHMHYYPSPFYSSRSYVIRDTGYGGCKPTDVNGSDEKDLRAYVVYFVLASLAFMAIILFLLQLENRNRPKKSVVKLQVALKGAASSSLQEDLNHIARQANTSTNEGYKYVLEESTKALLRHSEFWLSSFLSEKTRSANGAERLFNELSFEERRKFDKETLVNVDNHQEERQNDWEMVSVSANPFIIVNIIVTTTGQLNLPPICSAPDLDAVLTKLGGLTKREIMAVLVLWTPQEENDHLSSERLQQDYPLLMELRPKLD